MIFYHAESYKSKQKRTRKKINSPGRQSVVSGRFQKSAITVNITVTKCHFRAEKKALPIFEGQSLKKYDRT